MQIKVIENKRVEEIIEVNFPVYISQDLSGDHNSYELMIRITEDKSIVILSKNEDNYWKGESEVEYEITFNVLNPNNCKFSKHDFEISEKNKPALENRFNQMLTEIKNKLGAL